MKKNLLAIINLEDFPNNRLFLDFVDSIHHDKCQILYAGNGYSLNNSALPSFHPKDRRHFLLIESPNEFSPNDLYFNEARGKGKNANLLEISNLKFATIFSARKTRNILGGEVILSSLCPVNEALSLYEETSRQNAKETLVNQIDKGFLSGIAFTYRTLFSGKTKLNPTYVSYSLMTADDNYAIAYRGKIGPFYGIFPDQIKIGF